MDRPAAGGRDGANGWTKGCDQAGNGHAPGSKIVPLGRHGAGLSAAREGDMSRLAKASQVQVFPARLQI